MPELPEVETIMTLVKCRVENKKIKKTKVINPKLRWPIETRKVNNLENKTIRSVLRRGKYLIFKFKSLDICMDPNFLTSLNMKTKSLKYINK